jgi:hypothetical protein
LPFAFGRFSLHAKFQKKRRLNHKSNNCNSGFFLFGQRKIELLLEIPFLRIYYRANPEIIMAFTVLFRLIPAIRFGYETVAVSFNMMGSKTVDKKTEREQKCQTQA